MRTRNFSEDKGQISPNSTSRKTSRRTTVISKGFLFNRRNSNLSQFDNPALKILEECFKLSKIKINQNSIFSKKMLLKLLRNFYNSLNPQIEMLNNDFLLEHIYKDLASKYAIPKLAEKRLREMITSCFKYSDEPKIRVFLRLIGAGEILSLSSFKNRTFKVLLETMHYMNNTKLGIMVEESGEKVLYPKLRAIECSREIFENKISKNSFYHIIQKIHQASETDPFAINKDGVINYDSFIEIIAEHHQEYQESVLEGLQAITYSLTGNNKSSFLSKGDFIIALKNIYQNKAALVFEDKNLMNKYYFLENEVHNRTLVTLKTLEDICLMFGLFIIQDVRNICNVDEITEEVILETLLKIPDLKLKFEQIDYDLLNKKSPFPIEV